MKKLLVFLAITVWAIIPVQLYAQTDSYTTALVGMMQIKPEYKDLPEQLMTNFKPVFIELNKALLQDINQSEHVINQYTPQFYIDFVSVFFVPSMKAKVTETELKQYTEKVSTPSGKLFLEHNKQATQIATLVLMGEMASKFSDEKAKEQLREGKLDLEPIKPKPEIPRKYVDGFYAYYGGASSFSTLIDKMASVHPALQNATGKERELQHQMINYLKDNMSVIILNSSYGILTTDDLKFGAEINPLMTKITDGMSDVLSKLNNQNTMQTLGIGIVYKYVMWLQSQNIPLNKEALNEING